MFNLYGRKTCCKTIYISCKSTYPKGDSYVMSPVAVRMCDVFSYYPTKERSKCKDGFWSDEHSKEEEISVLPGEVCGCKVLYGG